VSCLFSFIYKLNSDFYPKQHYRELFVIESYCVLCDLGDDLQDLIGNLVVMKNEFSDITTCLWTDFSEDAVLPNFIKAELPLSYII